MKQRFGTSRLPGVFIDSEGDFHFEKAMILSYEDLKLLMKLYDATAYEHLDAEAIGRAVGMTR